MKLNNLYDITSDGWKYTVLMNIKAESGRCYIADFCRSLRKGNENPDFVRFMKSLDFDVSKIYGGLEEIIIETEPVYIRKS